MSRRVQRVVRFGLPVVLAIVVAVGAVGWWQYIDVTGNVDEENVALVDEAATGRVQSEVAQGLEAVLTYDHADPGPTEDAADQVLSGQAREEYDTLFASLQERAPDQELVLTAQVAAVGVSELHGDAAELLVFVDQSSRRAGEDQASVSAAQLAVSAERHDGRWNITGLEPL